MNASKGPALLFDLDGTLVDSVYQHAGLSRFGLGIRVCWTTTARFSRALRSFRRRGARACTRS
ncbi:MAG: hypothetical protein ACLQGJ_11560 [Candidatus Dormibacteria bacterium]